MGHSCDTLVLGRSLFPLIRREFKVLMVSISFILRYRFAGLILRMLASCCLICAHFGSSWDPRIPAECMQSDRATLYENKAHAGRWFNGFPRGPTGRLILFPLWTRPLSCFQWFPLKGLLWGPMRCALHIPF